MKLQEIYNVLLAGKEVAIKFATWQEFNNFRTNLYRIKSAQDTAMIDLGMIAVRDKQVLSISPTCNSEEDYKFITAATPGSHLYTRFKFKNKQDAKDYAVTIIETTEQTSGKKADET